MPTDPTPEKPPGEEQSVIDRLPPNERGQDEVRTEVTHQLGGSRPLTSEEKAAAEHDTGVPERVYAPASERVPKEPVPGHRDVIEHTDTETPERQAAAEGSEPTNEAEPSFTRVVRPSVAPPATPTPTPYASATANPGLAWEERDWDTSSGWMPRKALAGLAVPIAAVVGVWMFVRWRRRREQNRPINRLRRQAREIRDRVPSGSELGQPLLGVMAAGLSTALMIWRQTHRQSAKQAQAISDADWQKRLVALKDRWHPGRLELEKVSISRHH